jgi:hypothetical protein
MPRTDALLSDVLTASQPTTTSPVPRILSGIQSAFTDLERKFVAEA